MVDQLQCDSCLESSDAENAQRVSLATPPKLWQAVKMISSKVSSHSTGMQHANCRRVHAFWKGNLVSVSGQALDAAWPIVSIFDFGLWWMFRQ